MISNAEVQKERGEVMAKKNRIIGIIKSDNVYDANFYFFFFFGKYNDYNNYYYFYVYIMIKVQYIYI